MNKSESEVIEKNVLTKNNGDGMKFKILSEYLKIWRQQFKRNLNMKDKKNSF